MDVDVVILSLNRSNLTIETVENILAQEDVNAYIWIVDQGSEDEDLDLLRQLAANQVEVSLHEVGYNTGVAEGRNIGMRLGKFDFIVCIDNDAVFEAPDALRLTIQRFEKSPELGVIGFRIKNYFTGNDDDLWWAYPKEQKKMREQEFLTTRYSGCGHAIRRSVLDLAGEYDPALFFFWEEVDFSNRVINCGYQIIYCPEISVLHKVSPVARIRWSGDRYYYVTRNAIYLRFKYYNDFIGTGLMALGYLIKGIYNGVFFQALRGIWDAIKMCLRIWHDIRMKKYTLNDQARQYIVKYELQYRGSYWKRLKKEVFVKLQERSYVE